MVNAQGNCPEEGGTMVPERWKETVGICGDLPPPEVAIPIPFFKRLAVNTDQLPSTRPLDTLIRQGNFPTPDLNCS
jgi:hypothetical protein